MDVIRVYRICSTVIYQRESGRIFDLLLLLDTGPLPVASCPKMAVGTGIGAGLPFWMKEGKEQPTKKGMPSPNFKKDVVLFFLFFLSKHLFF